MAQTWREFFETLVAKAGNAAKLAAALKWSDTKVSRLRAYQGSFPNGAEALALAAYAGVALEQVAALVAKAEALWLAGRAARLESRRVGAIADTSLWGAPPRKPAAPSRLVRSARQYAMAGGL